MAQRALLICFTGVDGSGKTTQAELLMKWLMAMGVKSMYVWSGGEILTIRGILLSMGRRTLGTTAREIARDKMAYDDYQSRKSKFKENLLVRMLWSVLTYVEHIIQIALGIRWKMQNGCTVVCDRYLWDSIVDLAVLNHKEKEWLLSGLNKFVWRFVPPPTITFFIDIPPEEAIKRKTDIPSYDYVSKRVELYRYLSKSAPFVTINGCEDIMTIQDQITNIARKSIKG
jgi:dTMP kinase